MNLQVGLSNRHREEKYGGKKLKERITIESTKLKQKRNRTTAKMEERRETERDNGKG